MRLPPLANGTVDPLLEHYCYVCQAPERMAELFWLSSSRRWMCRDRVACYRRIRLL